jgi:hypothetical protein
MDLDADGTEEIVVLDRSVVHVFELTDRMEWVRVGNWSLPSGCAVLSVEMIAGRFTTAPSDPSRWPDLEISGLRFRMRETAPPLPACPG